MTATILQFRPRPNPTRDTAQLIQSMYGSRMILHPLSIARQRKTRHD